MDLKDLLYLDSLATHRHFGRAAEACNVSQPTLSIKIRKFEEELGIKLLERTNKRVAMTPAGLRILEHARHALQASDSIRDVARAARDPLVGPIKLGVIPTLAPYLMPYILKPLHETYPGLSIDLWEDQTHVLVDSLRSHKLDAALLATKTNAPEITEICLFVEPLLAVLPRQHRLAKAKEVDEDELADELLVLAEGHCLANQALAACGDIRGHHAGLRSSMQAATLDTLVNLVAAGYGTTLIPSLAMYSFANREIVVRPLARRSSRTIRLTSRSAFPRPQALRALEKVIRKAVGSLSKHC
ncbi:MAG TPA: LysR substrate-binding domain-containing protein [Terracidiphilus sp.]